MAERAPIDTSKVTDRRELHFADLADIMRDAQACAAAERNGTLRLTGNWTLGQILGHLAFWMNAPYEGYPGLRKPPWIIKIILKFMKGKFIRGPMPKGVKIPKVEGGTLGRDVIPTDEAMRRLEAGIERLRKGPPTIPNIVLGPLTHHEWIKLNLRHSELHLGYAHP